MDLQSIAFDAFNKHKFAKDIRYVFASGDVNSLAYYKAMGGSPAQAAWMVQSAQKKVGIQMQVTKQVSDDLMATDFGGSAKVDDVPWPNPVIEFFFEDKLIPTIILMKTTPDQYKRWFPELDVSQLDPTDYLTGMMQEGIGSDAKALSLQLKPNMYEAFLQSGDTQEENMELGIFSHDLSPEDNCCMAFMVNLCLKVLAFSSIPEYKATPITRGMMTRAFGGKPGVNDRPSVPTFRTQYQYLPRIIRPKAEPQGGSHEFLGRLGHIRFYRSEVFKNMKGKWDWIRPIANPKTGKYPERKDLKVRKPTQG